MFCTSAAISTLRISMESEIQRLKIFTLSDILWSSCLPAWLISSSGYRVMFAAVNVGPRMVWQDEIFTHPLAEVKSDKIYFMRVWPSASGQNVTDKTPMTAIALTLVFREAFLYLSFRCCSFVLRSRSLSGVVPPYGLLSNLIIIFSFTPYPVNVVR